MSTPEEKHKKLADILEKYRITYDPIKSDITLEKVYSLYINKEFIEPNTCDEYVYYGIYYQFIEKDYVKMKLWCKKAIDLKSTAALCNLGIYYRYIKKNYIKMKKYYKMAIKLNFSMPMNNLGAYYHDVEKNNIKMKKYYKMAIKLNNIKAISNLAKYYKDKQKWQKALEIYLLDAKTFEKEIRELFQQKDVLLPFLQKYTTLIKDVSELKLENEHLKYKPGRVGAISAKQHFESLL